MSVGSQWKNCGNDGYRRSYLLKKIFLFLGVHYVQEGFVVKANGNKNKIQSFVFLAHDQCMLF